jgi:hypothetical protein
MWAVRPRLARASGGRYGRRMPHLRPLMFRPLATALLGIGASVAPSLALRAQVRPPDITVVAAPAFRPTAVLLPHFQFWVAADTAEGGVVLRDLTIAPVTFTGTVRLEGAQLGAREPERPPFADSVRFGGDGQVTLVVADSAIAAPLVVEPLGAPGAAGGRLVVTAPRWPFGRALLVTIDPADLYEHRWRSVGYGVRDRVRIDDRRTIAFLADSTIRNTVVAIGPGPGTLGGIRTDATTMIIERRFGEAIGRERRAVGALLFSLEPARDAQGRARWEIDFALGTSEEDAARTLAAVAASAPPPAGPAGPRVTTPSATVGLLLGHLLAAERPMLDYDRIAGFRNVPAGAYTYLAAFDRDGWYGATGALQLGDAGAVCSEYALFKRYADPSGAQRHEIWNRLGPDGRYVWTDEWGGRWMGDKDPYQILKGYACYRATRDSAWLAAELPNLRRIARYVLLTDHDGDGLVEGMSSATYSEMSPLSPDDAPYATEDPYVNALTAYALDRLGELEDAAAPAARKDPMHLAVWRLAAARIRGALPALWRPDAHWFAYHALPDGSRSWDHYHLQPIDALVFGGVTDTTIQGSMVTQVLRPEWWDGSGRGLFPVPNTDDWHDMRSYWRGWDWHILDFKAFEAALRFARIPEQRLAAWRLLTQEADRIVRVNYGRPGERGDNNGLFQFSVGAYLDLLARGLFGVDEHLDAVEVAPHVDGIADGITWQLDGWRLSGDSLAIAYRPADRAATLRVGAPRRTRLVLRFPWLAPSTCVEVRRGGTVVERRSASVAADGAVTVEVPGGSGPAEIRVAAGACGS